MSKIFGLQTLKGSKDDEMKPEYNSSDKAKR
jgi:hypothetical protein